MEVYFVGSVNKAANKLINPFAVAHWDRHKAAALYAKRKNTYYTLGNILKFYTFLLLACACFVGCSNEPTPTQLELVDRLIQEQIDIPYKEPNFGGAEDLLLKYGETAEEATEKNKQLYNKIHKYLVALKNKPYKDKKEWAINHLELTIDHWENTINTIKSLDKSDKENKEILILHEQRKKWLTILKE